LPPVESATPPMLADEDLARLRAKLTAETRKELEALPAPKQWQQVAHWIRQMRRPARAPHGMPPTPDDDRLAEFFEKGLTPAERDRLLGLPSEEMQQELMRLFLRRTKPQEGLRHRPEGSDFGPPPSMKSAPKKKSQPRPE